MNETQIQAQIDTLLEQRNTAMNTVVNMAGQLAVANAKVKELTAQLEAATALISDNAEEVTHA